MQDPLKYQTTNPSITVSRLRRISLLNLGPYRDCLHRDVHFCVPGGGSNRSGSSDRVPLCLRFRAIRPGCLHSLCPLQDAP